MKTILDELAANYILPHSKSTVLQDWMKGRHSEVNELNGLVVKALEAHGHKAPTNQAVVEFALAIERGEKTRGTHNYGPLLERIAELKSS
ncbi:MAG: hypothetical protein HOM73_04695 [Micrococcales bacterium]|nr:hypothetical protein [Micrococcales bacterium]MBT5398689.1 hypothetical protein [Micrococcales bacterium]